MDEAEHGLYDLLFERLLADDAVDDDVSGVILAAWLGDAELADAVAGQAVPSTHSAQPPAREPLPQVFLSAVRVAGFRGVGAAVELPLQPGPGLTLVTGRNGSGKSSFAEAAELVLTGESGRWSGRSAIWREGWRNLHNTGEVRIAVDLASTGSSGPTRIERTWAPDAELSGGQWTEQRAGARRVGFDGSAWRSDMLTYRPFLSYGELGALIDGKPSELYDSLHDLLGLGPLTAAKDRLRSVRKRYTDEVKTVSATRRGLRTELAGSGDDRLERAAALLARTTPDLGSLAALVAGAEDPGSGTAALRALAALHPPDPAQVHDATGRIRAAADRATQLGSADARSAQQTAELLRAALGHQRAHGSVPCPVCAGSALNEAWRIGAEKRADQLERLTHDLRDANAELRDAVVDARRLAQPIPSVIDGAAPALDVAALRAAWSAWVDASRLADPAALADGLDRTCGPLHDALTETVGRAQKALAHRDEVWAPAARRLAAWHDDARRVADHVPALQRLELAEKWLAATAGALRDQRLAPFAQHSQRIWQALRQQSNVDLGPVRLDGSNTRRRVALDVRVDGAEGGTALGVMSQGELHALGLSLFLPRATVEHSPFRFVLIDDPVQAMDPAKVDGLARVLAEVATDRQVVVFSHDDRLAEAVRRLQVPATIWEVQRGERSTVTLRRADDPVQRYLRDARAMAKAEKLPPEVRGELVASCCRGAIEAACHARVRAVRLGRGDTHAAVDAALAAARTTHDKATLAVFDNQGRGGDLMARLGQEGRWAVEALQDSKQGAHRGLRRDLRSFVDDAGRLAAWIRQ